MVKQVFIIAAAALMASCGLDPKPVDPELDSMTVLAREKYEPILTGEWYKDTTVSDKLIFQECLKLNADHSFERVIDFVSRKLVTVNGVETYTDWEHSADTTNGKWSLNVYRDIATEGFRMRLCIYPDNSNYIYSIPTIELSGANDTAIFTKNYYVGYLKRRPGGKDTANESAQSSSE